MVKSERVTYFTEKKEHDAYVHQTFSEYLERIHPADHSVEKPIKLHIYFRKDNGDHVGTWNARTMTGWVLRLNKQIIGKTND